MVFLRLHQSTGTQLRFTIAKYQEQIVFYHLKTVYIILSFLIHL